MDLKKTYNRPDDFLCCGCEACVNICPTSSLEMMVDSEGFLQPTMTLPDSCTSCGLCNIVCPVLYPPYRSQIFENPIVIAAYNNNDIIRKRSSSGGIFTLLAQKIISKGGKVYGAGFDKDFSLIHMGVDNIDDLESLRGSKYLQSRIGTCFYEIRADLRKKRQIFHCIIGRAYYICRRGC